MNANDVFDVILPYKIEIVYGCSLICRGRINHFIPQDWHTYALKSRGDFRKVETLKFESHEEGFL